MHTDASHIFERGADWGATPLACDRVADSVLASAGGELEGEPVDAIAGHVIRHGVWLRRSEMLRHLGQEIPDQTVERILRRLGFAEQVVKAEIPERLKQTIKEARGQSPQKRAELAASVALAATGLAKEHVTDLIAASKGWGPSSMVDLPTSASRY